MLHEFLSANRALIIARARSKVAVQRAPPPTAEELENGTSAFLDQVIARLTQTERSPDTMSESATRHGGDLLKEGFSVARAVQDYAGVRLAVADLAVETNDSITAGELRTLNECIDDAIARAVTEYTRRRELSINFEGAERLGALAHELRNALGSAMISFEILKRGSVGLAGGTVGVLTRSLRRLSTLVDSSLAEVRLESGLRSPERISLREFMEEVEIGASMEAHARDVTLDITPVDQGVEVEVDRQLLAAAVANLLHNAFKFGRPKGHVSLRTSATDERVVIEVADECGGLPPGKAETLFTPFEQRGADRTGVGLGLSITRKTVEANGGTIRVRDVPGTGCVFTIDLPRLAAGA